MGFKDEPKKAFQMCQKMQSKKRQLAPPSCMPTKAIAHPVSLPLSYLHTQND